MSKFVVYFFMISSLVFSLEKGIGGSPADKPNFAHVKRGFIVKEHCYTSTYSLEEDYKDYLLSAHLKDGKLKKSTWFPGTVLPPNQFRIAQEQLWSVKRFGFIGSTHHAFWGFQFTDFLEGNLKTGKNAQEGYIDCLDIGGTLYHLMRLEAWHPTITYYDYLPSGPDSARLFLLIDRPISALVEKVQALKNVPEKKWTFTTAQYRAVWGPNPRPADNKKWKEGWKEGKWSDEEILEVAFTEPFHVYGLGDDYYFVTETGKVYYSPPLKKGDEGPRRVMPFWVDSKQPVKHLLTQVDGKTPNLTFAFGDVERPERQNQRDRFCFALQGPQPDLKYFAKRQLEQAKVEEPLKTLLEYARLIVYGPPLEGGVKETKNNPFTPNKNSAADNPMSDGDKEAVDLVNEGGFNSWLIGGGVLGVLMLGCLAWFWQRKHS